ncbi:helix-turn-helix domain-containing protein, partial [Nocardia sp. CC201C]|uniref:helix-turn-helix domain-containing protein n=1 Tax=Nocardia sp. CC201C TaxID=3044575 RepID=UPI0032C0B882
MRRCTRCNNARAAKSHSRKRARQTRGHATFCCSDAVASARVPPSALRDRKRERTRRALLEAAVELFETRGYEATTVADIAATA